MNENYIYDEEPHILNEKFGYIIKKCYSCDPEKINNELLNVIEIYCKYLYENSKYKFIDHNSYKIIITPPHQTSLGQYFVVAIKFKRLDHDNLEKLLCK